MVKTVSFKRLILGAVLTQVIPMVVRGPPTFCRSPHELGHVLQYERFGGIESFLVAYIPEVIFPPYYPKGPLEQEAERLANTVCPNPA